jgi:signal transduction histidine kinase
MIIYFDGTFFSVMKIIEGNNNTIARKLALILSYVLFVVNIVLPVFLLTVIYRRFEILKIKEAKQSFNTMLLQIDKASKIRVANPAYFFFRRLMTAILLTLPIDNTFIFLQYVFILMSSHAYILYMVAVKPYQTYGINSYILANETFYSALIIAIFIFSDATPELNIKYGAGICLMASLVLLVLANVITNIAYMIIGRDKLKKGIKEQKLKRAEKEALERAEEEERRLKQKKEEEEFTKLPDDT